MKNKHLIQQGHIDQKGLIAMIVFFATSKVFLNFPALMAEKGHSAGWMIALFAGLVSLVIPFAVYFFMSNFQETSFPRAVFQTVGSGVGMGICLIVVLFLFFSSFLEVREFAETIITAILPQTPISVIILGLFIAMIYAAIKGVEGIARACILFSFPVLFALGIMFLGSMQNLNLKSLAPWFGPGMPELVKYSFWGTSFYADIIVLAILFPYLREPNQALKGGLAGLVLSIGILVWVELSLLAIFPYPMIERLAFPLLMANRLVSFGEFLQRAEAVFAVTWFLSIALKLSLGLHAICLTLAEMLRLPDYKQLIWPVALIGFTFSFIPDSIVEVVYLANQYLWKFSGPLLVGIVGLLALAVKIKHKPAGGKKQS